MGESSHAEIMAASSHPRRKKPTVEKESLEPPQFILRGLPLMECGAPAKLLVGFETGHKIADETPWADESLLGRASLSKKVEIA